MDVSQRQPGERSEEGTSVKAKQTDGGKDNVDTLAKKTDDMGKLDNENKENIDRRKTVGTWLSGDAGIVLLLNSLRTKCCTFASFAAVIAGLRHR
jgi:hypothetical protein